MKIYHPKYGIVDQRYFSVYCTFEHSGENAWPDALKSLTDEQLLMLKATQLETENYEGAFLIQKEVENRNLNTL